MTDSSPSDQQFFQFDANGALLSTNLPFPKRSGKVRDVYDLGNSLMIVSTDRISAFDYILSVFPSILIIPEFVIFSSLRILASC